MGWLIRAGYLSHGGELLPLGERVAMRLRALSGDPGFPSGLGLAVGQGEKEIFFPSAEGPVDLLSCPACGAVSRREFARARQVVAGAGAGAGAALPPRKVATPDCPDIESLARFLQIPASRTAKALLFVRERDGRFGMAMVRGDMFLSEAKLEACTGLVRLATEAEIRRAGAEPGYASPVGLTGAWVIVDELIAESPGLVAGANEAGYHLENIRCGRDFVPDLVADLTMARPGDACHACGGELKLERALVLAIRLPSGGWDWQWISLIRALAETCHDDRGLTLPVSVAPFEIYLLHVPGKTTDTRSAAAELEQSLTEAGRSVLFDDREERAGVKFADADLIGCPLRVTVGERGLPQGLVEVKSRTAAEVRPEKIDGLSGVLASALATARG